MTTTSRPDAPGRGEIWLTILGAARPGELGKTRPAVVVSAGLTWTGSSRDRVCVVPLSTSSPFTQVSPRVSAAPGSGLQVDSAALCDSVRGVVPSRLAQMVGRVSPAEQRAIDRGLAVTLGLPAPPPPE
jgi:mRNA interferase MazF